MKNPPLHRYATRPGLYFTDDGGADAVVRSETADQVWFCVLEPLNQPSAFYADAVRLFNEPDVSFIEQAKTQRICTRRIPSLNLRETLFHMDGPNYGLWYVHLPKLGKACNTDTASTAHGIPIMRELQPLQAAA